MKMLKEPPISVRDEKVFFRVVKTAFSQRRKTLSNSLKPVSNNIKALLYDAGIDPQRRPETLSLEEFAMIADILST
jgi:16S rRNA (adenine1518-N6/adenine1519-N6)-dimethyltransferase